MKIEKLVLLGLGYIGLPTACTFANHGVKVIGVDVQETIVETLNSGKIHIHEPGLLSAMKKALSFNTLEISLQPQEADAFIIAVPTPFYDEKKADLSYVKAAAQTVVPYLRKGNLVILESTSPPLTTQNVLVPILERSGLKAGTDFMVAYSPERVLPGKILTELVENARVIGGVNPESAQAGKELYSIIVKGEIITTDAVTAEMVKLMENTYRDINIAIANEFARLADRFGVNVWEAIDIANLHPRVEILRPGPGVGGHCISVDPWFLIEAAPDLTHLINAARIVNDSQPHFVIKDLEVLLGTIKGKRISILGLAYKPDVDDLRESPAIEIARLLQQKGAYVCAFEPNNHNCLLDGIKIAITLEDCIADGDLLLVLVAHKEFKRLTPTMLHNNTKARVIYDAVNVIDSQDFMKHGFSVKKLGEP